MSHPRTAFAIETDAACEQAMDALAQNFRIATEDFIDPPVRYYDTFDWRVLATGNILTAVSSGGGVEILWQSADGLTLQSCTQPAMPDFVWDLPSSSLRKDLEPILKMRRLLPVVDVHRRGHLIRILNADEKTVARVRITQSMAQAPGSRDRLPLGSAKLLVMPVRGYNKSLQKLLRVIEGDLSLEPLRPDELKPALAAIGRTPTAYSSKARVKLDPALPAGEAIRKILRALFEAMLANEEGTKKDLDSEFLHDFRVAVRRTRSALTQIKDVLPPSIVEQFRQEFSWLGSITGPTRDLDVYLLKMPDYESRLPASVSEALKPLRAFLKRHQRLEQRRLGKHLRSPRYAKLIDDWRAFLESPSCPMSEQTSVETPRMADRPIAEVAAQRIWKTYRKVAKEGRAIQPETPAEAVHALRLRCKKLRYLLEFFRVLYPTKVIEPLIKSLKQLQDNLGDFNDYEVQQGALTDFALQMSKEGDTPVETLMAMGRLVDHLETGQANERRQFAEHFAIFDAEINRQRFQQLFAPQGVSP